MQKSAFEGLRGGEVVGTHADDGYILESVDGVEALGVGCEGKSQ